MCIKVPKLIKMLGEETCWSWGGSFPGPGLAPPLDTWKKNGNIWDGGQVQQVFGSFLNRISGVKFGFPCGGSSDVQPEPRIVLGWEKP